MSIKLISLRIIPNEKGWESELLKFGTPVTLLKGENGSGKTPLILSALYCLGYASTFRRDIVERCKSAVLNLQISGRPFSIEREFKKNGNWTALGNTGKDQIPVEFSSERKFAEWFFEMGGMPLHKLTQSNDKEPTIPYLSTLLPTCYVDQTGGWQQLYYSSAKFIKDQHQEMYRLNLGLSPKHPFERKDALVKEKQNLLRIEELAEQRSLIIKELESASDATEVDRVRLEEKKRQLSLRVREIREQMGAIQAHPTPFESQLADLHLSKSRLANQRHEVISRVNSAQTIQKEIESEIETLSLNADAAERFRKLCGSDTCKLFCASEEAYGKSLLYLKDQMKDLSKDAVLMQQQIDGIDRELRNVESEMNTTKTSIANFTKASGIADLKTLLERVSSELIDLEVKIAFQMKIDEQRKKYQTLLDQREQTKISVESLQASSRNMSDKEVSEMRSTLGILTDKWLKILDTPNINGPCSYDENLNLTIDGDKLSVFKGSTLTRIILAFHAATIELSLSKNKKHLGFCIMDTPMQQEIKVTDLQDYFKELRDLLKKNANRIQVCISFSDANIVAEKGDEVWTPKVTGLDGKLKYLKEPKEK